MTPIIIYAIVVAGIVLATVCREVRHSCWQGLRQVESYVTRYLVLTKLGRPTRWLSPWPWWVVFMQAILIGINLFLVTYRTPNRQSTGQRAGQLAVVNTALFYLGPSLAHLADWIAISWSTMKLMHGSTVVTVVVLLVVHIVIARPTQPLFVVPFSEQFYGVIVGDCTFSVTNTC